MFALAQEQITLDNFLVPFLEAIVDDEESISIDDDTWFEEGIVTCVIRTYVLLILDQGPEHLEPIGIQDDVTIIQHVPGWPKLLPCISGGLEEEGPEPQQEMEGVQQQGEAGQVARRDQADITMADHSQRQNRLSEGMDVEMREPESTPLVHRRHVGSSMPMSPLTSLSPSGDEEAGHQKSTPQAPIHRRHVGSSMPLSSLSPSDDEEAGPQLQVRKRPRSSHKHIPEVEVKRCKTMKVKMPNEIVEVISLKRQWVSPPASLFKRYYYNFKIQEKPLKLSILRTVIERREMEEISLYGHNKDISINYKPSLGVSYFIYI